MGSRVSTDYIYRVTSLVTRKAFVQCLSKVPLAGGPLLTLPCSPVDKRTSGYSLFNVIKIFSATRLVTPYNNSPAVNQSHQWHFTPKYSPREARSHCIVRSILSPILQVAISNLYSPFHWERQNGCPIVQLGWQSSDSKVNHKVRYRAQQEETTGVYVSNKRLLKLHSKFHSHTIE